MNASSLLLDNRTVPLDGKSNLLVRYRGPKRTFPYISAVDVMRGQLKPGVLADKIVLVGTTALGTREVVSTPLDTLFAGVEVQATVADNLAAAGLHQAPRVRGRARDAAGHRSRALLCPVGRGGLVWRGAAAGVAVCLAGGLVRFRQADGDERRLHLAALSDDGTRVGTGGDDRRPLHERAAARRSGRRGEGDVAAADGAVAAVADRGAGTRRPASTRGGRRPTRACSRNSCRRNRGSATS